MRSIYWKIMLPLTILVLAGMGILGAYIVSSSRHNGIINLQSQLTNEARLVGDISQASFIDQGNQSEFDNILLEPIDQTFLGQHYHQPECQYAISGKIYNRI